ncbi:MAG: hypothetical protein AB4050_20785 [Synechococcus sp.]
MSENAAALCDRVNLRRNNPENPTFAINLISRGKVGAARACVFETGAARWGEYA